MSRKKKITYASTASWRSISVARRSAPAASSLSTSPASTALAALPTASLAAATAFAASAATAPAAHAAAAAGLLVGEVEVNVQEMLLAVGPLRVHVLQHNTL